MHKLNSKSIAMTSHTLGKMDTLKRELPSDKSQHRSCGFDPWVRKIPWWRKRRIPWTEEADGLKVHGAAKSGTRLKQHTHTVASALQVLYLNTDMQETTRATNYVLSNRVSTVT